MEGRTRITRFFSPQRCRDAEYRIYRPGLRLLAPLSASLRLCGLIIFFSIVAQSQTVEKVDPPNWWTGVTINPVRVLLRGTGLKNAKVTVPNGLTAAGYKYSDNGHYLF